MKNEATCFSQMEVALGADEFECGDQLFDQPAFVEHQFHMVLKLAPRRVTKAELAALPLEPPDPRDVSPN